MNLNTERKGQAIGECLVLSKIWRGVDCMTVLKAKEYKRFENIKHIREADPEFWNIRSGGILTRSSKEP